MMSATVIFCLVVSLAAVRGDKHLTVTEDSSKTSLESQLPTPDPPKWIQEGELHVGPQVSAEGVVHLGTDAVAVGRAYSISKKQHGVGEGNRLMSKARSRLNHTAIGTICGNKKCDNNEICVYKRDIEKHICVYFKNSRFGRKHSHGHFHGHHHHHHHHHHQGYARFSNGDSGDGLGHVEGRRMKAVLARAKIQNGTELNLRRVAKLKARAHQFQEEHDRHYKLSSSLSTPTNRMSSRLRAKKYIDNGVENNTSEKWNKDCRQREMDVVGKQLLDNFKMDQDNDLDHQKMMNRRRKEKRNSTKKELHEDDECICQAPVSWKFQRMDVDADGHLSREELENLTTQNTCTSQFIASCNHDNDGNLGEKEWCCCFAHILPPCLAALRNIPSILLQGRPQVLPGAFVPQCDDDGFYSQVQCHGSNGQCWCVDRNGKRIGDYITTGSPECVFRLQTTVDPTSPQSSP